MCRCRARTVVPPFTTLPERDKKKWCDTTAAKPFKMIISSVTTREGGTKLVIPLVTGSSYTVRKTTAPVTGSMTLGVIRSSARQEERETHENKVSNKKKKLCDSNTSSLTNKTNNDVGTSSLTNNNTNNNDVGTSSSSSFSNTGDFSHLNPTNTRSNNTGGDAGVTPNRTFGTMGTKGPPPKPNGLNVT